MLCLIQTSCITSLLDTFALEANSCKNFKNVNVGYLFFTAVTASILDVHRVEQSFFNFSFLTFSSVKRHFSRTDSNCYTAQSCCAGKPD